MRCFKHGKNSLVVLYSSVLFFCLLHQARADDGDWRTKGTAQGYLQLYSGSDEREGTYNIGGYFSGDYLDSTNISFGYNFTYVDFKNNAELSEHVFYLSGQRHFFPDNLPGKITARLDIYAGRDTLRYRSGSAPSHRGHRTTTVTGSSTIEETTDISVYQPQLSFINYSKTLYADIGYAHSEYNNSPTIKANQLTPTLGFGWNDSYDWLQLRGYLISVDNADTAYDDDQFNSLEMTYTHWFVDKGGPQMELVRFSVLAGKRVLAVDPDAAAIYATADTQTGSFTASVQWKLSPTTKMLALGAYGRNENSAINDEYNSLLFYVNLQQQW
ncbi:MAG: hypothetical protein PVJ39_07785 [Gammaproteobacteria bacterium]|jgi:hypothetical protein